jgi:glycerophosphoryl diester phosphodiesterase
MSFKHFGGILVLLLISCSKLPREIENLSNGKIAVVGHGGMGFQSEVNHFPHNSYTSIVKALEAYNCDGVEVDVQLSRDSVLILYHDETLQSMSNCSGCLYENYSEDILNCRYRNDFFNNLFHDEKIISLNIIFKKYHKTDKLIFLDLKLFGVCGEDDSPENYNSIFLQQLLKLIDDEEMEEYIIIQSLSVDFLNAIKIKNSKLKLVLEGSKSSETIETASKNNFWGVLFRNDLLNRNDVLLAHQKELRVGIFDVKTRKGTVDAINKHPDFIQTDNILLLQDCLKKIQK